MKSIKSFNGFSINESRLIMSSQMLDFLETHSNLWVSRKLLQLQFNSNATDTINFLQPKGKDDLIFSKDSDFLGQDEETFNWDEQNQKNWAKVGRIIRKLLHKNNLEVGDKDIEIFVNYWKSFFMNPEDVKFRIVSEEEIRKWYFKGNYHPLSKKSPLYKSCMAKGECQKYFDIYCQNPEVCQMIIMLDEEDKLMARALIWTTKEGKKIVDRIYYMNPHLEKHLIKWIKEVEPEALIYNEDFFAGNAPKGTLIQLKKWKFKKYPYLDTFSILNWQTGELSSDRYDRIWNETAVPLLSLTSTTGEFRVLNSNFWKWSKSENDFLQDNLCYWNSEKGDYLPLKGFSKVKRVIKNWLDF